MVEKKEGMWRDVVVDKRSAGRRIDVYLSLRFFRYSRSSIARFIQRGEILSDLRQLKPSSVLILGERLKLFVPGLAPSEAPPPLPPILYEDQKIIVVNKPAGMLVHPSGDRFVWALIGLVKSARPDFRIDLAHRLDRDTSGALILTKDLETNAFIKNKIAEHRVRKVYLAIVRGIPPWERAEVEAPIGEDKSSTVRLKRGVQAEGKVAWTSFKVLKRMNGFALIECMLHTGRTHQIRIHLEHLGFPILGDKLYGQPDKVFLEYLELGATEMVRKATCFPRHALHAHQLVFPLPTGGYRRLRAPLALDMKRVIEGERPEWKIST